MQLLANSPIRTGGIEWQGGFDIHWHRNNRPICQVQHHCLSSFEQFHGDLRRMAVTYWLLFLEYPTVIIDNGSQLLSTEYL